MIHFYTAPTPNGRKVAILLEELGLPYTVHRVDLGKGEQFTPEFLSINPNAKIPAIVDELGPDGHPFNVFESGAILIYLAEKAGRFLPHDAHGRSLVIQWVMFQMANIGPALGNLDHFVRSAPEKAPYAIKRFADESKRILGVMDGVLGKREYLAVDDYTIADVAAYPWIEAARRADAGMLEPFKNVSAWLHRVSSRPAVQSGMAIPR